jgi:hypothetical protein
MSCRRPPPPNCALSNPTRTRHHLTGALAHPEIPSPAPNPHAPPVRAGSSFAEEEQLTPKATDGGKTGTGLTFVVVGASGDLAKKKIFPALFALYMEGSLGMVLLAPPSRSCTTRAIDAAANPTRHPPSEPAPAALGSHSHPERSIPSLSRALRRL